MREKTSSRVFVLSWLRGSGEDAQAARRRRYTGGDADRRAGAVLANRRLSDDYNVLALAAPAIAAAAQPGQFVMLKAGARLSTRCCAGHSPCSRFSATRRHADRRSPFSASGSARRRALIYDAEPGERVACLGPLGRPFTLVEPPAEAWMVAGGVGLAPFATLAEALRARGVRTTLFYGARRGDELFYLDLFRGLGVELVLDDRGRQRRRRGRVVAPLDRRACGARPGPAA